MYSACTSSGGAPTNAASDRMTPNVPWHRPTTGTPVAWRMAQQLAVMGFA